MARDRLLRRRLPWLRRTSGVTVVALGLVLLVSGCLDSPPDEPVEASPTPIGQLKAGDMVIPRIEFCDLIPEKAIEETLDGDVDKVEEWGNGDEAAPTNRDGQKDVAHEFGCSWRSADGVTARAWVFARPVNREFARQVAGQTSKKSGCRIPKNRPDFGSPTQLQVCDLGGGITRARHSGLFGDAWLSCEVEAPETEPGLVRKRAGAWCVHVANALDTSSS